MRIGRILIEGTTPMLRLVFVLVLCVPALAEVPTDPANRLSNNDGRSCGWCALETLARTQGIEALYGIRDARQRVGGSLINDENAKAQLDYLGVRFTMQTHGERNPKFLSDTLVTGRGVAVWFGGRRGHVVLLVELTAESAKFV